MHTMARSTKPAHYTFAQLVGDVKRHRSIRNGKVNVFDEHRLKSACAREYGTGITYKSLLGLRVKLCRKLAVPAEEADAKDAQEIIDLICGVKRCPPELAFQQIAPGSAEKVPGIWLNAVAHNQYLIDYIYVGLDTWHPISRADCLIVSGKKPTLCPDADPVMPADLLASVVDAFCKLGLLKDGQTIHWVGVKSYVRGRCRCYDTQPSGNLPIRVQGERVFIGDKEITLNLTTERRREALCLIRHVLSQRGGWITGPDIAIAEKAETGVDLTGTRWDRVFKSFPPSIKKHIESRSRKGYRLRTPLA
jgi:hypothetical protein